MNQTAHLPASTAAPAPDGLHSPVELPGTEELIARGRDVIRVEALALDALASGIGDAFAAACRTIFATRRQLVVTGMGKSGHIARKVAATFAATGTPAIFIHPGEAAHGDLGMLVEGDTLLVLSNSGNTSELRAILDFARCHAIPVIGMASRPTSLVIQQADISLMLPKVREACAVNVAPTTSTTMQLALGDALAMTVMDMRGIAKDHLRSLHPGGSIGLSLMPVSALMHGRESLPLVEFDAGMTDTISVMTSACFGIAGVVDATGALAGIITDGDLRRHFALLQSATAAAVMTATPKLLPADMPAGEALVFLNDNKITAAFVVDDPETSKVPLGIIHIHDLLRIGLG